MTRTDYINPSTLEDFGNSMLKLFIVNQIRLGRTDDVITASTFNLRGSACDPMLMSAIVERLQEIAS